MATTSATKEACNDIDCTKCEACNKKMETFFKDVILKLDVRMPKEQGFRKHGPHYLAQPSTSTTPILGPGSIVYDPFCIQDGVNLTKTMYVSAVKEYENRNKMKDSLIETLAKMLLKNEHLQPHCLLERVTEFPSIDPPDFDRYILKRYLNDEQLFQFDHIEKKMKNHLGFRVVRQVGPDGILVKWNSPSSDEIIAYELFINGLFVQRIQKWGRKIAMLHPVDLNEKLTITLKVIMPGVTQTDNVDILYPENTSSKFSCCLNYIFGSSNDNANTPEEFIYMATNPLKLEIVRRVGPCGLMLQWMKAQDVYCYEVLQSLKFNSYFSFKQLYADGVFMQRIDNPERTKSILHPIDLNERIVITLNPLISPK